MNKDPRIKSSIKDIPKEDGYYWLYRKNCSPTIIYFRTSDVSLSYMGSDMDDYFEDLVYEKLVGPIELPES